jgi:uncharacterized protein
MIMECNKSFAVVTGASRGLGRCFVLELAKRGINTILVALPDESLNLVAEEAEGFNTESYIYETDLTKKENIIEFASWVNSKFEVFMLINNAGRGGSKSFMDSDVNYIRFP